MATITATGTGNWSDTTKWDLGRVPAANDVVVLGASVMTWDAGAGTRIPATSGTLTSMSATTGYLTVPLNTVGAVSLYCTTITAGTSNNGILQTSGNGAGVTFTVDATGGGVTGGTAASANAFGIYHAATNCTLAFTGDVTGGSNTVTPGIKNNSTGTLTVVGNVTGGSGTTAYGIMNASTGAVTVTGNLTGGTGAGAAAFFNVSTATVTLNSCNLINGTGATPYHGKPPTWNNASDVNYITFANTGRNNNWCTYPAVTDVWQGVAIGASTGTKNASDIPNCTAGNIKNGVTIDDVTGTYTAGGGRPEIRGGNL